MINPLAFIRKLFLCKFDRARRIPFQLPLSAFGSFGKPLELSQQTPSALPAQKRPDRPGYKQEAEARLQKCFHPRTGEDAVKLLEGAAESAAAALGFVRPEQEDYLARFAIGCGQDKIRAAGGS
jgi:hypothetical protein